MPSRHSLCVRGRAMGAFVSGIEHHIAGPSEGGKIAVLSALEIRRSSCEGETFSPTSSRSGGDRVPRIAGERCVDAHFAGPYVGATVKSLRTGVYPSMLLCRQFFAACVFILDSSDDLRMLGTPRRALHALLEESDLEGGGDSKACVWGNMRLAPQASPIARASQATAQFLMPRVRSASSGGYSKASVRHYTRYAKSMMRCRSEVRAYPEQRGCHLGNRDT